MGDVVEFPSNAQKGLNFLENGIKELLSSKGKTEQEILITLNILKDVYRQYGDIGKQSFNLQLSNNLTNKDIQSIEAQVTKGIANLNKEHAKVINKLASELVLTKLKLYRLETKLTYKDNK